MTSVICWINRDDYLGGVWAGGVWAVSDSRVSGPHGVLTENCPKLSVIHANSFDARDFLRRHPKRVISFGFGFAGSTLVGANVREMLVALLGDLNEVQYYDAPDLEFEAKIPALAEIAELTRKLTDRYINDIGVNYPNSAKSEIVIFGFCRKSGSFKVFKISNSPDAPALLRVDDVPVSESQMVILGDKKALIEELVQSKRSQFEVGTMNWRRTPIIVLSNILSENQPGSIGGYLQLCAAFRDDVRHLLISSSDTCSAPFVGFDLFRDIQCVGGFSPSPLFGLVKPGTDGWPAYIGPAG